MPPLAPVPGVIQVVMTYTEAEDINTINRIFLHYGGAAPTSAQLATYAGSVGTAWAATLAAQTNGNTALTAVQCTDISGPMFAQGSTAMLHTGTNFGNPLSAGCAACVSLRIARRFRGGHSRQYLPGRTQSDLLDSQKWTTAFTGALQSAYGTFIAQALAAVWPAGGPLIHEAVSRFVGFTNVTKPSGRQTSKPTPRVVPLQDPVIAYAVNPRCASQRRRNLQGGG